MGRIDLDPKHTNEPLSEFSGPETWSLAENKPATTVVDFSQNGHPLERQGKSSTDALALLDTAVNEPVSVPLGEVVDRFDIESTLAPFKSLPDYKTTYPAVITDALSAIFAEYNGVFGQLVEANKEADTDYQYTRIGPNGSHINRWVQIDMVGLPQRFLDEAPRFGPEVIRQTLKQRIFEIENSIAMYQLMQRIHSKNGEQTRFERLFRESLDTVREQSGKKIALLAVTNEKHQAIRETEFGKLGEEILTDKDVFRLSGFDKLFSPEEFIEHIQQNGGNSDYLLFVRSSDPIEKLRNPQTDVEVPILADPDLRRIIKSNAITFNIDKPDPKPGSPERINDTKAYLPLMGMGYRVNTSEDVFVEQSPSGKTRIDIHPLLRDYLQQHRAIVTDEITFRAKPLEASFGCYGQVVVNVANRKDRQNLNRGLRDRGPYVIQPEMQTPIIINKTDGQAYTFIDRNIFGTDGTNYQFLTGIRLLMPIDSIETRKGRTHGNTNTVSAEIY